MTWERFALAAGGTLVLWVGPMLLFRAFGRQPTLVGPDGKLTPCPGSPNCVCSQDPDPSYRLDPLTFTGAPSDALARLRTLVEKMPRTHVVTATETYLHVECRTFLFRFIDDVEFVLDADARVIHCRSASRAGRSDFGVNRRRIEWIRTEFASAQE